MKFNTALLHGDFQGEPNTGATTTPIYQSSAFAHESAEKLEKIFANQANFDKFLKKPTVKVIDEDLALQYAQSKYDQYGNLLDQLKELDKELALLHKTYIRGLGEMKLPVPSYPDANFTIRQIGRAHV